MADFDGVMTPSPNWDQVPSLGVSARALAGPGGPMNAQAQALLNRSEASRIHQAEFPTTYEFGQRSITSPGNSSFDSTTAINKAVAWSVQNNTPVRLSGGKSAVSALNIPDGAQLIGGGPQGSRIIGFGTGNCLTLQGMNGVLLRDFGIDSSSYNADPSTYTHVGTGIFSNQPGEFSNFQNLQIRGFNVGSDFSEPSSNSFMHKFDGVIWERNNIGLKNGQGFIQTDYNSCRWRSNFDKGAVFDGNGYPMVSININGGVVERNGLFNDVGNAGMVMNQAQACRIATYFEGNKNASLLFDTGSSANVLVSSYFYRFNDANLYGHGVQVNKASEGGIVLDGSFFNDYATKVAPQTTDFYGIYDNSTNNAVSIGKNTYNNSPNAAKKVRAYTRFLFDTQKEIFGAKIYTFDFQNNGTGTTATKVGAVNMDSNSAIMLKFELFAVAGNGAVIQKTGYFSVYNNSGTLTVINTGMPSDAVASLSNPRIVDSLACVDVTITHTTTGYCGGSITLAPTKYAVSGFAMNTDFLRQSTISVPSF